MNTRTHKARGKKYPLKNPPFSVYISKELNEWLRATAKEEGRTLTAQVERAIVAYRAMLGKRS